MTLLGNQMQPDASELRSFYESLAPRHLQPLWTQNRDLMPTHPTPAALPWRWDWRTLRDRISEAGRLVSIDRGGDRRVLALANPGLKGRPFATSTLWGAVQYLGPGEGAPAHRHSQGAVRFVLEGSGVWTTVNGDACDMAPGDLVLTPSWTWHDHRSGSDHAMIWFDGLDMPLVDGLDAQFFELDPSDDFQDIDGRNLSLDIVGDHPRLTADPLPPSPDEAFSPTLVYRWQDTEAALAGALAKADGGVAQLSFVSPVTGRALMPTLGCSITRVAGGARTRPLRSTGSSIFVVRSGSGRSVIGGVEISWQDGDMFVAPSWSAVEHHADSSSDLFAVTDRPALEALHLYREEYFDSPQAITKRFDEPLGA